MVGGTAGVDLNGAEAVVVDENVGVALALVLLPVDLHFVLVFLLFAITALYK